MVEWFAQEGATQSLITVILPFGTMSERMHSKILKCLLKLTGDDGKRRHFNKKSIIL